MKNSIKVYFFVLLHALCSGANIVNAQTCATVERFKTATFARLASGTGGTTTVDTYSQNAWVGSGAGNIDYGTGSVYFSDNSNTQTFTQAVTSVNLKGTGATFAMSFSGFNGNSQNFRECNLNSVWPCKLIQI